METLKFKTNIKCSGCIATITPFLNGDKNISSWEVDLASTDRILTVTTDESVDQVTELLKKAGYSAKEISE